MPQTILCQKCKRVLNLPPSIAPGRRLKCPGCEHRFVITESDASSASTVPGDFDAKMASTHELARRPPSRDEMPIPVSEKDLRESFDLASLTGEDPLPVSEARGGVGDVASLFKDDPGPRRKVTAAEARSRARRCKSCGGVVPQGMSICESCGLDQETGQRYHVGLDDLLPPPPPRPTGPPLHVAITGYVCGLGALILTVASLVMSIKVEPGVPQYAWLALALVSAFAIYAAVQFLLGKTPKLLLLALTLWVFADLIGLIALPIFRENFGAQERAVERLQLKPGDPGYAEREAVVITPIEERLDRSKIQLGVFVMLVYALFSAYLMSPPVKRYFIRMNLPKEL